ncbi:MAG: protein kinase [Sorangiineae bacterium]|nr:protein kinase [Polyangiaceae bacterium]MEB2322117.1 protein kinase [Sorangiineae bacterium]
MVAARLLDVGAEGRQRVDRYELIAEIASGGMATVYLARLLGVGGFQRFVAIKRLHPHLAGENEFVEMFLDEARLAAGIHHPNVVPILEVGASDRGYYLVMEYIEGDTLARLLARAATSGSKLPVPIGIRIVIDLLAGLHAAHELRDDMGQPTGLVHRDVSPQNVLVGADGVSRITDFGVARAQSRLSATRVGQLKGKIAYMAPEQATGKEDIDRRADIFSAGIVLWEVLAARRLFKADNEAATLSRVISEPIPKLTTIASDVSPQIAAVCMKALERDVNKRFKSCAEFADALERAATAAGTLGAPRDVKAYVAEVIGNEIAQAREAVRGWLARSEPSQVVIPETAPLSAAASSLGSVSSAAMTLPEVSQSGVSSPAQPGLGPGSMAPERRSRTPMILGALIALVGVGVIAALMLRGGAPEERAPAAHTTASPSSDVVTAPVPEPTASAAPAAPSAAPAEEAADAGAAGEVPSVPEPTTEKPNPRPWRTGPQAAPKPTAKPDAPPKPDVDLSNPYR